MSNLTIKTEVLEALGEVNNSPERDLVFSTGEENPARAVDATCNTLDLILQGLAVEGLVNLNYYEEPGIHQCQECGQIYWGEGECSACEFQNGEDFVGPAPTEEHEEHEEPEGTLSEFQQIFINKVNITTLQAVRNCPDIWERFNPLVHLEPEPELVRNGLLQTDAVLEMDDEDIVALLVGLRTPGLPDVIWDRFREEYGDVAYELVHTCTPLEVVKDVTLRYDQPGGRWGIMWDCGSYCLGNDDQELANLYLKWVRPGTSIPECIQVELS